jgi:ATP-dependent RNA helicase DDX3X
MLTNHSGNSWVEPNNSSPAQGGYHNSRGGFSAGGRPGSGYGGAFQPRQASANWDGPRNNSGWSGGGSGGGAPRETYGYGTWRDDVHIPGARNMRMEKELYGDASDPSKQHTGINFEKYDDIPVEATGAGVPEPITQFTNPPLDPVLLENIGYARYTVPTPVQKYSIPIVANGRDLMACAQVSYWRTIKKIDLDN